MHLLAFNFPDSLGGICRDWICNFPHRFSDSTHFHNGFSVSTQEVIHDCLSVQTFGMLSDFQYHIMLCYLWGSAVFHILFKFFRLYQSLQERMRTWRLGKSPLRRRSGRSPTATRKKEGVCSWQTFAFSCTYSRSLQLTTEICFDFSFLSLSEPDIHTRWRTREETESTHWEGTMAVISKGPQNLLVCRCHLHIDSQGV